MKLVKQLFIIVSLFITSLCIGISQGTDAAEIFLTNGEKIEGRLIYPIGNHDDYYFRNVDGKVHFNKENGEQIKINSEDVKYIIVNGKDYKLILRYTQTKNVFTGTGKISKGKAWVMQRKGCKKLHSYVGFGQLYKDKDGELIEAYTNGQGEFCLQSEGEKIPSLVGFVFLNSGFVKMQEKQRKNILTRYFKGNKDAELKLLAGKKTISQNELDEYIENTCSDQ